MLCTILELDAVELGADDKVRWDASLDSLGDQTGLDRLRAILVGASVSDSREELGEEIAMCNMEFDAVEASFVEILCCVSETLNNPGDLVSGSSMRL